MVNRGRTHRLPQTLMVLGLITWTAAALSIDNGHVGVFHDDGIYLVSAQALRDGRGYQLPSRPGNPPPKYPPGLPLAIATVLRWLPGTASLARDTAAARAVVIGSGLVFFTGGFSWLRRVRVLGPVAACIMLGTAFHPSCLTGCASAIFSDLTFWALSYLAFLASPTLLTNHSNRRWLPSLLTVLLSGASVLVRTNGVTLVSASLASSWSGPRHRSHRLAAYTLGLGLFLTGWYFIPVSTSRLVPSGDYRLEMKAAWSSPAAGAAIVGRNLSAVLLDFPIRVLLPLATYVSPVRRLVEGHPALWLAMRLVCSAVVLVGLYALARRGIARASITWIHALATIALFLVWPWTMILDRFLLGLFPLVFLGFWVGLKSTLPSRWALMVLVLLTLQVVAVSARSIQIFHAAGRQWPGASHRRSLDEALRTIRSELTPDAVIAARWPDTVYLYTGRQAVPLTEDDDILIGRFEATDRLRRWMDLVPDRPFYLLVRGAGEDPRLEDRRQAEALGTTEGITLQPQETTSDGRYELIRVIRG